MPLIASLRCPGVEIQTSQLFSHVRSERFSPNPSIPDNTDCEQSSSFHQSSFEPSVARQTYKLVVHFKTYLLNSIRKIPDPMADWWQCCSCAREVNTEIHGDDCPDCGHVKCDHCYNLAGHPPPRPKYALHILQYPAPIWSSQERCIDCNCGCDTCSCEKPPPPPPRPTAKCPRFGEPPNAGFL